MERVKGPARNGATGCTKTVQTRARITASEHLQRTGVPRQGHFDPGYNRLGQLLGKMDILKGLWSPSTKPVNLVSWHPWLGSRLGNGGAAKSLMDAVDLVQNELGIDSEEASVIVERCLKIHRRMLHHGPPLSKIFEREISRYRREMLSTS